MSQDSASEIDGASLADIIRSRTELSPHADLIRARGVYLNKLRFGVYGKFDTTMAQALGELPIEVKIEQDGSGEESNGYENYYGYIGDENLHDYDDPDRR